MIQPASGRFQRAEPPRSPAGNPFPAEWLTAQLDAVFSD